jgi:hypothetical protein
MLLSDDEVMAQIKRAYTFAVLMLGKEAADREWKAAAKKTSGRPKGSTKPEHDLAVLEYYDALAARAEPPVPIKNLPGWIGKRLAKELPGKFTPCADSNTRRLRRLLKQRSGQTDEDE